METSAKIAKDFQLLTIFAKNSIQMSGWVPNTCYKIVVRKFPIYRLKQKWAKKLKLIIQDSLKVGNTPTHHCREHNDSGTTQVLFLAKFQATSSNLGQIRYLPQCSKDIMHSAIYYKMQITN